MKAQAVAADPVLAQLLAELASLRNGDGGWGAASGLPSNTEATSLGLMVAQASSAMERSGEESTRWLVARQREDGSWPFTEAVAAPSWSSSLATLALGRAGEEEPARRGLRWLLGQEGRSFPLLMRLRYRFFPEDQAIELDPSFKGWPWAPDTFGWVEPTAYALVALKALRPLAPRGAAARIRDGERMILDRVCAGGGWNYGNSRVLDEELEAFPDTTALALIALQDAARAEPIVRSIRALRAMLETNRSGLTLALSVLCLELYGEETAALKQLLGERYLAAGFLGETRTLALAALALSGTNPFRVSAHA
jgi:hypothetical protein